MTDIAKTIDDPQVEHWSYGHVAVALDHRHGKIVAIAANWLPGPGELDPIELDWQAFIGDLKARYGTVPAIPEPEYDQETDLWVYELDTPTP